MGKTGKPRYARHDFHILMLERMTIEDYYVTFGWDEKRIREFEKMVEDTSKAFLKELHNE